MGNLGATELLIILAIVLLLFGSTRLPKMARSLGQASKEFRKGVSHNEAEADHADADAEDESESPAAEGSLEAEPAERAAGNGGVSTKSSDAPG